MANLTVDPQGRVVIADRTSHSVFRLEADGTRVRIAGNGTAGGGGDGQLATATGLEEVRGLAFVPSGGFFACTHRGSDVWFIDRDGIAHLFISGVRNSNPFGGEGTLASGPGNKLSEIRAINITPGGDLILTQSDESNVRIVENLCPSGLGASSIERMEAGEWRVRWLSNWDGAYLEQAPDLVGSVWTPVSFSDASLTGGAWNLVGVKDTARGFFRTKTAARWPAP